MEQAELQLWAVLMAQPLPGESSAALREGSQGLQLQRAGAGAVGTQEQVLRTERITESWNY